MVRSITAMVTVAATIAVGSRALAGGPPPVYMVVERVVIEPAGESPERITIWGSFIRQEKGRESNYGKPVEGFISLSLDPKKAMESRNEWKRWEKAAGTGKVVAVGMCGEAGTFLTVKIHEARDRVSTTDAMYTPGHLGANDPQAGEEAWANQPAVKALLAFVKKRSEGRAASPAPARP
jgi:hypothetical protein